MTENKTIFGLCLLLVINIFNGCINDDALNLPFLSFEPKNIGDGLTISRPADEGMNATALMDIYERCVQR